MYNYSLVAGQVTGNTLAEKIEFAAQCGICNIELQNNFLKLDESASALIHAYRNLLIETGAKILVYEAGSVLNNRPSAELLFAQAMQLSVGMVKIQPEQLTGDSLTYVEQIAAAYGIDLVIENERNTFALSAELEVFLGQHDAFGLIVNPMEFVSLRRHPFFHEFYKSRLKSKVKVIRVADAYFDDGAPAMPGKGDGELKELVSMMLARSFNGYFSFIVNNIDDLSTVKKSIEMFRHLLMEM